MKICSSCKEEKQPKEFNKNKSKKDGLNTMCRVCSNLICKERYKNSKGTYLEKLYERQDRILIETRTFVLEYLKTHPCVHCGQTNIMTLEFDHLRDKFKDISMMIKQTYGIEAIKKEVDKCQVLCSNCHNIKTQTVQRSWKYKYLTNGSVI